MPEIALARLPRHGPNRARELALGFVYWLAFLLLLQPGNLAAAEQGGWTLDAGREAVRIAGAASLGALATPLTLWLVRRLPVAGRTAWRNASLHALACAGLAATLIVVSCPLAAWLIDGPSSMPDAIRSELTANWALLFFGLATLTAVAHAVRFRARTPAPAGPAYPSHIPVTSGRRTVWLDVAAVDWIEAQGNYVALHAAGVTHLVRSTLSGLEATLDPQRFVRIHRRVIVAIDRVEEMTALDGGDADLRLRGGLMLRLSRTYREAVRKRL